MTLNNKKKIFLLAAAASAPLTSAFAPRGAISSTTPRLSNYVDRACTSTSPLSMPKSWSSSELYVTSSPNTKYPSKSSKSSSSSSDAMSEVKTSTSMSSSTVPMNDADIDMLAKEFADASISTSDDDLSGLEKFSAGYQRLTKEHYLPMAFGQAAFLASLADIITQSLESHGNIPIDFAHVLAMATVASTMSGVMNAIWLRQLEAAFPGKGSKEVFLKTMIHAVILASIINSAYLAGVPFLTSAYTSTSEFMALLEHPMKAFESWTMDEFITLTKLEICMFIPYNTLAFNYVPPSVRPLTHAAVSATFNVAVSAVTLGYFDKWVYNAMHMFN